MKPQTSNNKRSRSAISDRFDGFDMGSKPTFSVEIANNDTSVHRIALFPGLFDTAAEVASMGGIEVDAIAQQGTIITNDDDDVLVSVTGKGLEYLQRYLRQSPMAISRIQVTGKTELQLSQSIIYKKVHPLRKSGEEIFTPRDHQSEQSPNTRMVSIGFSETVIGAGSVFVVDVAPGDILSLAITFGAAADAFQSLEAYEVNSRK